MSIQTAILPTHSSFTPYHWLYVIILAAIIHMVCFIVYPHLSDELKGPNGAQEKGSQGLTVGLRKKAPAPAPITEQNNQRSQAVTHDTTSAPREKKPPNNDVATQQKTERRVAKSTVQRKQQPKAQPITAPKKVAPRPAPIAANHQQAVTAPETVTTRQQETPSATTADASKVSVESGISTQENSNNVTQTDTASSQQPSSDGGGDPTQASYHKELIAWLENHKRYPSSAKRRGQEGVITLAFSIDALGNLIDYSIISASPYKKLNNAVIKMIKSAAPLPTPPPSMIKTTSASLQFTIPIVFSLR